jgi:hypothetical protein
MMMAAYHVVLARTDDTAAALRAALVTSLVVLAGALVLAVRDLRLDAQRDLGPQ